MMRKIIQICSNYYKDDEAELNNLYALCNDGSCWVIDYKDLEWRKFPDIPQEDIGQIDCQKNFMAALKIYGEGIKRGRET